MMDKAPLRAIRRCGAPACDIFTNKRYRQDGVVLVACCPKHAETAYALLQQVRQRIAVAA